MVDVITKQGKPDDLDALQQLFIHTISFICSKDYNKKQIIAWTSSIKNGQRWLDIIGNQFCLIVEIEDKIVGFGTLENGSHIDMLYVHKDFQRKGIATNLYLNLEEEAIRQHNTRLTSEVSKTARPFFENKGFVLLSEQVIFIDRVEILNYKMTKEL